MLYGIKYTYLPDEDGYEITGYTGKPIDVLIPEMHQGKRIVSVGKEAFADCKSLEYIALPNGVRTIKYAAFDECLSLQTIDLPSSLERIEWRAFHRCISLSFVDLPDNLLEICESAFTNCVSITSIRIPAKLVELDFFAFEGCSLIERIDVSFDNQKYSSYDGILYSKNGETLIRCPVRKTGLVTIPEGTIEIEDNAFTECQGIVCLSLPHSLKRIGKDAFMGCSSLEEVLISGNVYAIEGKPFDCCAKLTDIYFTAKTQKIESDTLLCFSRCYSLTSFHIHKGIMSIDLGAIKSFPSFERFEVSLENATFSSDNGVLYSKDGLKLLCCPRKKEGVFNVPEGIKEIGSFAFRNCQKLTEIDIPASVDYINRDAFSGAKNLTKIEVDERCRNYASNNGTLYNKLEDGVVWWIRNDEKIEIPTGTKILTSHIFDECNNIVEVTLPATIKCIQNNVFKKYSNIKTIIFNGSMLMFNQIDSSQDWCNSSVSRVVCNDGIIPRVALKKMFISHIDLSKYSNKKSNENSLVINIKLW